MSDIIYFGRPGELIQLHHPRGGVSTTRTRPAGRFEHGDGGASIDRRVDGARQFELTYESLTRETFHRLLGFDQGHEGPGPFVFLDPGQRNMLTVNQSGATTQYGDTDNFTLAGSGWSMASEVSIVHRGPNSLKLTSQFAGQTGTLTLDPAYAGWPGIPVYPRPHVLSFWARLAGDTSVDLTVSMQWLDASGAVLSTETDNTTVSGSGSWVQVIGIGVAPADTAYCNLTVAASGASVSAGTVIYFDEFQFEEGTEASDWSPGTGILPVAIESLTDKWPWQWPDFRQGPAFILSEDTT